MSNKRATAIGATLLAVVAIGSYVTLSTTTPAPLVIIFMENKPATSVIGNPAMPYLNTFAKAGLRFTNYTESAAGKLGPSLPDYLSLVAGSGCGKTNDVTSAGAIGAAQGCPTTVWNQLEGAGVSWGVYGDAMPTPCSSAVTFKNTALDTQYALRHVPAQMFASIWSNQTLCKAHVLPFSSFDTTAMPAVSFVAPGICNDQHGLPATMAGAYSNCLGGSTAMLSRGDSWLAKYVPAMVAAGATVFITYDEKGVLYAAEQGPGITPGLDSTPYTHYSVLRAIEDRYGFSALGGAATATPLPLT